MTNFRTLAPEDFEWQYDDQRTFPFFEDQDARIFGYGHPNKSKAAAQVKDFYEYCDPTGGPYLVGPEDVKHLWAIAYEEDDDLLFQMSHYNGGPVSSSDPGAFPIWMVSL